MSGRAALPTRPSPRRPTSPPSRTESATADVVAYSDEEPADSTYSTFDADYPDESLEQDVAAEDHPEELVSDDPESDTPDDDEPELPEPAEEAALHTVDENEPPVDEVTTSMPRPTSPTNADVGSLLGQSGAPAAPNPW